VRRAEGRKWKTEKNSGDKKRKIENLGNIVKLKKKCEKERKKKN
jgi:hypothetical protein